MIITTAICPHVQATNWNSGPRGSGGRVRDHAVEAALRAGTVRHLSCSGPLHVVAVDYYTRHDPHRSRVVVSDEVRPQLGVRDIGHQDGSFGCGWRAGQVASGPAAEERPADESSPVARGVTDSRATLIMQMQMRSCCAMSRVSDRGVRATGDVISRQLLRARWFSDGRSPGRARYEAKRMLGRIGVTRDRLSPPLRRRAPNARTRGSAASTSSTMTSKCNCCGRPGSGH